MGLVTQTMGCCWVLIPERAFALHGAHPGPLTHLTWSF